MKPQLKICGMKLNTAEVAKLQPDYLGFIFYEGSKRNFEGTISEVPKKIKRVGVFVNASVETISEKMKTHQLDVVQLHGDETPQFCEQLYASFPQELEVEKSIEIWKVFGIKDTFDFNVLQPYETVVDKFLFDTKGKEKGGNGYTFDWTVLNDYSSTKPFILSGGIGLDEVEHLKAILKTGLPIHAIDVNSKFEHQPGLKNIDDLKKLQHDL